MSTQIISNDTTVVKVETLTLEQTAQIFRTAGISTTSAKIADGIEQGAYPFGICIRGKSRKFQIFKKQVDEWLLERGAPR